MHLVESLLITQIALTVLGLGGLVAWLRREIAALRGAVDAQKKTIEAQVQLIGALDTPQMVNRFKAYQMLVEHEKTAQLAAGHRELSTWHTHAVQAVAAAKNSEEMVVDLLLLVTPYLYYEPAAGREALLDMLSTRNPALRKIIEESLTTIVAPIAKELEPPKP